MSKKWKIKIPIVIGMLILMIININIPKSEALTNGINYALAIIVALVFMYLRDKNYY